MKFEDFVCTYCGRVDDKTFRHGESIPDESTCSICGSRSKRKISSKGVIVHQGRSGNAKNGYTSTGGNIKKS